MLDAVRDKRSTQPGRLYRNAPKPRKSFRRLAVKVFAVSLRIPAGMVNHTVSVIGRRVDCVELEWDNSSIDDVVIRPSGDDDRKTGLDRRPHTVKNRFPGPFLYAKELIQRVNFRPDLFLGL